MKNHIWKIYLFAALCVMSLTAQAQKQFTDFRFSAHVMGEDWTDFVGDIDHVKKIITFSKPLYMEEWLWIDNIAKLPATFTHNGSVVRVGGTVQTSGITLNDFRREVAYSIDGEAPYTVVFESPQASGLPVIKIDTEDGNPVLDRVIYKKMAFALSDPEHPEYDFTKSEMTNEIKVRGNSTSEPGKRPYRIKFDKKTQVFGLPAATSWVLLANYYDPTLIKNTFAYELADRLGMPYTHSYHHVEVYLNGGYRGSYLFTEHNEVGEGRVDIDDTKGWFTEVDWHFRDGIRFNTNNYELPVTIKSPEFPTVAPISPAYPHIDNQAYKFVIDEWNQLCDKMASSDFPENGYRDLIDMQTIINLFMVAIVTGIQDFDNPGSAFFYRDKGGKISGGPSWDFDINFGFNWDNKPPYQINTPNADYPAYDCAFLSYPFFARFFDDPVFYVKWVETWKSKYSEISSMQQFIDEMADKIRKSAEANFKQWWVNYSTAYPYVDFDNWIGEMKNFLDVRINFLESSYTKVVALPASKDFKTEINKSYSGLLPQKITLVAYGAMSNLNAQLQKGNGSDFEITAALAQTATGDGGYLATVSVKPKSTLAINAYKTYSDKLILSGINNGKSFSIEVPLNFSVIGDARLKSLEVYKLNPTVQLQFQPAFDPEITEYTINVENGVDEIYIECETNNENAKKWGWGERLLNVGENLIPVTVIAEDDNTYKIYWLKITRARLAGIPQKIFVNEISGNEKWVELYNDEDKDVDLTDYTLQKIDENGGISNWKIPSGNIIKAKDFKVWTQGIDDKKSFTYGISPKKNVAFKLFDEAEQELDYFEVKAAHLYSEGNNRTVGRKTDGNPILVVFLNGGTKGSSNNDGISEKQSNDATLKNLIVSRGTLQPNFSSNIKKYTVLVDNSVTHITVTGTANSSKAKVTGNVANLALNIGNNEVVIIVTSEDGTTIETYTVEIIRTTATGVESDFVPDLNIYPNPFNGVVRLAGAEGCVLQVITVSGVVVHTQMITNSDETIRLEYLPAGIYFFFVEKDGKAKAVKIMKF